MLSQHQSTGHLKQQISSLQNNHEEDCSWHKTLRFDLKAAALKHNQLQQHSMTNLKQIISYLLVLIQIDIHSMD